MDIAAKTRRATKSGAFGAVTDRTLAGLRLFLSLSALLIILIDPAEPNRFPKITHSALVAYILYASIVYVYARRHVNFSWRIMQYITWIDVAWYSVLITLSSGTNSVFFFFYLFAIIEGSSRGGTRLGLALTAVCTGLFLALNLLLIDDLELEVPRFARRTVYMAMLGYIMAYWGGAEAVLRRKLTFLKELLLVGNPRLGVDRTIRRMLRKLLDFYGADYCFFLLSGSDHELAFYWVTREHSDAENVPMRIREQADLPLMNSSDPTTAAFVERASFWNKQPRYRSFDPKTQDVSELPAAAAHDTADLLNVRSFITSPLEYRERIRGRVLVGSRNPGRFDIEDAAFLQQATGQVLPLIENIRMVDRLALDAAEGERRRIARSVHDRVVQPYLGLQIGLKALQRELFSAAPKPEGQTANVGASLLEQLIAMTRDGIDELRQYMGDLKNTQADETKLVDSIRGFAEKFERATGIHVQVIDTACELTMNDRLSAEVFQMTAEALSNIHRHTQSRTAEIRLTLVDNSLQLSVENDAAQEQPKPFHPRSIFERAEALGARTEILRPTGKTLVKVEVPL